MLLLADTSKWFIEPFTGIVEPSNTGLLYHGMNGRVKYDNGYTVGFNTGRYIGPFKLYASYDYTSFRSKEATINTPLGETSKADTSLYHPFTVLVNADYITRLPIGWDGLAGVGVGGSFDGATQSVFEARFGLTKQWKAWAVSVLYSIRDTQGQQKLGLKSDGSYSCIVNEPTQQRILICISKHF